jgi:hypothetical protein
MRARRNLLRPPQGRTERRQSTTLAIAVQAPQAALLRQQHDHAFAAVDAGITESERTETATASAAQSARAGGSDANRLAGQPV